MEPLGEVPNPDLESQRLFPKEMMSRQRPEDGRSEQFKSTGKLFPGRENKGSWRFKRSWSDRAITRDPFIRMCWWGEGEAGGVVRGQAMQELLNHLKELIEYPVENEEFNNEVT